MFKKILNDALKKNPEMEDAVGDRGIRQLSGMLDGTFKRMEKQIKDLPKSVLGNALAGFSEEINKVVDEQMPLIHDINETARRDGAELLGKWRHRMSFERKEVSFRLLYDFQHEVDALMASGMSSRKMQGELEKLHREDIKSRCKVIKAIEKSSKSGMFDAVNALLKAGNPAQSRTMLMDTPLAYAYQAGRMDVVKLLIDHGADYDAIGWTRLHYAIVYGEARDVRAALPSDVLHRPDEEKRTAFELCGLYGSSEKTAILQKELKRLGGVSDGVITAMCDAITSGDILAVKGYLDAGVPAFVSSSYGPDSAICLTETFDLEMLQLLLDHGLDLREVDSLSDCHLRPERILDENGFPKIFTFGRALMDAGWKPEWLDDFEDNQMRYISGALLISKEAVRQSQIKEQMSVRFGVSNPERVDHALWRQMIREGYAAYEVAKKFGVDTGVGRDGPKWCFDRFGMTTTFLPDGRCVQIAGEHEDHYDPDFHIYNDVVVHDGKGGVDIYCYPRADFAPTDFHTATLFDDHILIIGNCGYQGDRRVGETPVYRLNLSDFSIQAVETTGEKPGWINRHSAVLQDGEIVVSGGQIQSETGYGDYSESHALRIKDMVWRRVS